MPLVALVAVALALRPLAAPPAQAFAPVRLHPAPARVGVQCHLLAARSRRPFLCPARLPRATIPFRPGEPLARLHAQRFVCRDLGGLAFKLDLGYGAPWEPDSGPDWRSHLWQNRPCCFLHFEVLRRPHSRRGVPSDARPATLGGRRGLFKPAYGYGLGCGAGDRHLYWCNHVAFLWREHGADWVATLHFFAPGATRALLARLVRTLRPVT